MSHIKIATLALVATLSVLVSGCTAECVDKYDCRPCERNDAGQVTQSYGCSSVAKTGELWTCVASVCKQGNPDPGGDAGTP
jgi:hypothetical protein